MIKNIEQFVQRYGLENIWCKIHDRPPALLVDPLSVYNWVDEDDVKSGRKDRYFCSACLELPQAESCIMIRKKLA